MAYLQNLIKWLCVSFKPTSSESRFVSRWCIEQCTYVRDIKSSMFISFYSFIILSTFHLVFFFPSFPLSYLFVSLSSFYSFSSSPLPFTLYHIHLPPTCLLQPTILLSGFKSDIFPELSNHVERVGTLSLRIQAFTKPLKTSAHFNEHNRTETNRNFGW